MTKRLVLAVCTVAAVFTAVLTGTTVATAPSDTAATRITAGDQPVVVVPPPSTHGGGTGGSRPKPPTDTSWGG
ncbi:hypothetical protein SAMN04487983_1001116 [Streptomyces sp. yr375]|uniref:hypothetical protein n=1 Tax=Streptomyces sp. yr375 TaxID=1761906 RepID=UPI0008B4F951|nr:hypothetical protein [Streptomyces sp. yr375]SEP61763.1 hypothetical protein SAMN04487983_1001116 [Streptomyces sp. yr375]